MNAENIFMTENELSNKVIGLAIEVHTVFGPGLLESAYKECLYYKIMKAGLYIEKDLAQPLNQESIINRFFSNVEPSQSIQINIDSL